jgi:hypothetical protein
MDTRTKVLLQGLANSGALGAGVGALGMGAANILSPSKEEDGKKKSLLKSMLLGGALGGVTGMGGRAAWDYFDEKAREDSSSGINRIFSKTTPNLAPKPSNWENIKTMAAGHPGPVAVGTGVIGGAVPAIARYKHFKEYRAKPENLVKDLAKKTGPDKELAKYFTSGRTNQERIAAYPFKHPVVKALKYGGIAYLLANILAGGRGLTNKYNEINNKYDLNNLIPKPVVPPAPPVTAH